MNDKIPTKRRLKKTVSNKDYMTTWWFWGIILFIIGSLIVPIGSVPVVVLDLRNDIPSSSTYSEKITALSYLNLASSSILTYGNIGVNIFIESFDNNTIEGRAYYLNKNIWTIKYPHLVSQGEKINVSIPQMGYNNVVVIPIG